MNRPAPTQLRPPQFPEVLATLMVCGTFGALAAGAIAATLALL